jgi:uncharacterized protein
MMRNEEDSNSERRVGVEFLRTLIEWFRPFQSALVAFSSGVDSSLVALAAYRALGQRAFAVTSISPSFARRELLEARKIAKEIGIELVEVEQDDLNSVDYVMNQVSRCYFCRSNLVRAIQPILKERKPQVCVDGTHLDDMSSPRPGIKALREGGFRSPLAELGMRKEDVRRVARLVGLSNSEKPSEACLSSRIAYGQAIDTKTLRMIEDSEEFIRQITSASVVRVRTIGTHAVIELNSDSIEEARRKFAKIETRLRALGYSSVELDPEGYKPGKMLSLFVQNRP